MMGRTRWQAVKQNLRHSWTLYRQGKFGRLAFPRELFVYVTDRCNAKCSHCFYHESINTGHNLPLEGIAKLARTLPPVDEWILTGGEPFLRKDLDQITATITEANRPCVIHINTNGLHPEKIESKISDILGRAHPHVVLQVSIDGLRETHDAIREFLRG